MAWVRKILGISMEEVRVARRGFRVADAVVKARLERIGATFLAGYHASLEGDLASLSSIPEEFRGFAFEGAGMASMLLDHLLPFRAGRFRKFLNGPGEPHIYMAHVGAGWAIARLPWLRRRLDHALSTMDPLLRWLAVDGYGFHEGYFHWPERVAQQQRPPGLSGYALHAFDQGLGRSLWFVEGAEPARIAATIAGFSDLRRADLWSGVGLACAYAGGGDAEALARLSGPYRWHLAQGAAFAAQARHRAGNPVPHTELACQAICGVSATQAADAASRALDGAASYEVWRDRIRQSFAPQGVRV